MSSKSNRTMVTLVAALALLAVVCAPTLTAATGGPSSSVAGRLAHKVRAESEPNAVTTTTPEPATPAVAAASPAAPVAPVTPAESNAAQQAETAMNDMIIAMVNALPNNTWTAGVNEYFKGASYEFLKSSCGLKLEASVLAAAQNQIPYPGSPYNPNAVVQPAPYQPAPYQPSPYQPSPYQPSPYQPVQPSPYQPSPYQPSPYQPTPAPTPAPVTPSVVQPSVSSLPVEFDARQKWGSTCPSVYDIRDQAGCGSCWAVSSAEVMTDRHCIASSGSHRPYISAKNILTCCGASCGSCAGGYPIEAFNMWKNGVVTGGNFGSTSSCQPYFLAPCSHHPQGQSFSGRPKCEAVNETPQCSTSCENQQDYQQDKSFGASAYAIANNEEAIMQEIYANGPIVAGFMVYADFPHFRSGVYRHVTGAAVGGHAVKLMGWGVENGQKYWLAANSWNTDWGMDGFFKIAKGVNEGQIESMVWAGVPRQ